MGLSDMLFDHEQTNDNSMQITGITTGIVRENWESEFPGMVKVEFFLGETGKSVTDWIRVAQMYAGNGYGSYWLPEVGDEVILAFNMGDVNKPYVLGALWNNVDKIPDDTAKEKNDVKRIRTKGGHEIVFQEEAGKESIRVHTPGNLQLTLDDEKKQITIQDESGDNLLQIDSENKKIIVNAKENIKLDAGGKATLELDGSGDKAVLKAGTIEIEAKQTIKLKGQNFTGEGNSMALKGSSSLKAESGSMLVIKGSMVKIN